MGSPPAPKRTAGTRTSSTPRSCCATWAPDLAEALDWLGTRTGRTPRSLVRHCQPRLDDHGICSHGEIQSDRSDPWLYHDRANDLWAALLDFTSDAIGGAPEDTMNSAQEAKLDEVVRRVDVLYRGLIPETETGWRDVNGKKRSHIWRWLREVVIDTRELVDRNPTETADVILDVGDDFAQQVVDELADRLAD